MNAHLQRLLSDIDSATAGMDEAALIQHAEGKWSAAETLEHLSLAFGSTAKVFARCVEKGRAIGDRPSLKQRFLPPW